MSLEAIKKVTQSETLIQERKAAASAPKTKGYTPFESLGDLFSQEKD